jgi:uncharacterized protein (DUF2344 family)
MRLRITFSKSGALRYSGHLDLVRIWERSMRRPRLPLAYRASSRAEDTAACALPLGFGDERVVDMLVTPRGLKTCRNFSTGCGSSQG